MKRIFTRLLLSAVMMMCCTVMNAQYDTFKVGAYTYLTRSENTVGIILALNLSGSVVIPTTVANPDDGKTYNVTRIEDHSFAPSRGITSVTIPEGITFIGQSAFRECQITDLVIPSTVTSIGYQAFKNCSSLTSVTIKSGSIGDQAFQDCSNLTSISLQEGVTSIGSEAFSGCGLNGDLVIPSTVTNIGEKAFYNVNLTSVKVFALVPPELGDQAFGVGVSFYVPDVEKYKECDGWKDFQNIKLLTYFRLGDQTYLLNETGERLDQDLTFNDKDLYVSGLDFNVNKLTYSRTFKATGVWQTWFVPFDVPVSDMNAAGMEVAQIADVHISANEQVNIAVAEMTNTDAIVKANTPYLVKAKKSEVNMTLTGPVILRKSTDAELEGNRLTMQSAYNTSKIGGIYSEQQNSDWYALSSEGTFSKTNGTSLQPQRLWLTIKPRTDSPYTDPSASSELLIDGNVLDSFTTPLTGCPAVKVTKGDKEIILYAPDAVEMIKIPANK